MRKRRIKTEKNEILRQKSEIEKKIMSSKRAQIFEAKKYDLQKQAIKNLIWKIRFNQDIEELSQETENLVNEIEKMANVNIKFNNKDYLLSCDDGQEESLKKLTKFLDKKYSELKDKLGNIGENKLFINYNNVNHR